MKTKIQALAFISVFAITGAANAACSRPPEPVTPDGTSAPQEAMVAGQQAVKTFIEETNIFLDCLEVEEKEAKDSDDGLTAKEQNIYVERHNAAVDVMQAVAEGFNTQLRVFLDAQK